MPFIMHGEEGNKKWTIEGRIAVDKRFYALVTIGNVKRITDNTYRSEEAAKDAGRYLRDKMLAEVGTCRAD